MIRSGGFLGRLLAPLLKTGLPLIKNVIKSLAKSVLISLRLTAAASAADAGIHKKNLRVRSSSFFYLHLLCLKVIRPPLCIKIQYYNKK